MAMREGAAARHPDFQTPDLLVVSQEVWRDIRRDPASVNFMNVVHTGPEPVKFAGMVVAVLPEVGAPGGTGHFIKVGYST